MKNSYWVEWERFLAQRQMKSFASSFLTHTRPVLPIIAQLMMIGIPFFKGLGMGAPYAAILTTLADEDNLLQFTQYLHGSEG